MQNLNFEFLNSLEVLGHPGQNIDTLDMKFHQPLWVSGYVGQSFELIVMGSNPDSKISGGKGGRPQELTGGWMRVHMKRGDACQDCVDFSWLPCHVICLRGKNNLFY